MEQQGIEQDERKQTRDIGWFIFIALAIAVAYMVIKDHTLTLPIIYQVAILAVFIAFSVIFGIILFSRSDYEKNAGWRAAAIVVIMSCLLLSVFLEGRTKWARYLPVIFQGLVLVYIIFKSRHSDSNITSQ